MFYLLIDQSNVVSSYNDNTLYTQFIKHWLKDIQQLPSADETLIEQEKVLHNHSTTKDYHKSNLINTIACTYEDLYKVQNILLMIFLPINTTTTTNTL